MLMTWKTEAGCGDHIPAQINGLHLDDGRVVTRHFPAKLSVLLLCGYLGLLIAPDAGAAMNEHRPVCAPDGSRLVYMLQSERTNDDWELYQLDFSSQGRKRLTSHAGWDGYAVWSPDSRKIIFDREDTPGSPKQPWIMNMDDYTSKPFGNYEGWLSISDWSADDRLLGFHELAGQRDLVLLDIDGDITRNLTNTTGHSEHDAHFSPDGKRIAYANGLIDGVETSLEIIDLDQEAKTILRTSKGRIYGLSWSPDGQKLAFADAPGGEDDDADIFIYDFEEKSFEQLTDDPAWDHMPEYCHDNHRLFFTSYRSGEERIYQVDPDPGPFLSIKRAE